MAKSKLKSASYWKSASDMTGKSRGKQMFEEMTTAVKKTTKKKKGK